jgi:hypothetical protein
MRSTLRFVSTAAVAAALVAVPGSAQKTTGPKERYEMDVATMSGFAAMGGGKGGMGGAMSMMFGGGPDKAVAHQLLLRLGSDQAPGAPPPKGDHYFEPQARLGKSVPLISPERREGSYTTEFERPKGRLLLYWGCGAKAGPGQPVVIDFAKVAAGQVPPGLFSTAVPVVREVSAANSRSYMDWPNSKGGKPPSKDSSLLGAHRVASNVGSDINFTLAQDYMDPLQASTAAQGDGSVMIRWNPVQNATGYVAWTIGGMDRGGSGDMVWWTSSASREFGGGLWDWLPPATVAKLIPQKIVMPPSQTSCQIPAEVKRAAGGFMMTQLYAYGPERDFAYPPRPANPRLPWKPDWTAKVRYRSNTSVMLGMPGMEDMGDNDGSNANNGNEPPKKKCKPRITLGGFKPC